MAEQIVIITDFVNADVQERLADISTECRESGISFTVRRPDASGIIAEFGIAVAGAVSAYLIQKLIDAAIRRVIGRRNTIHVAFYLVHQDFHAHFHLPGDSDKCVDYFKRMTKAEHLPGINLLLVLANPKQSDPHRLSIEETAFQKSVDFGVYSLAISLHIRVLHAVRINDLRHQLSERNFQIIHFSGHTTHKGFALEADQGQTQVIPKQRLASLLAPYSPPIQCVILNSCYPIEDTEPTCQGIPHTIEMKAPICDQGASHFIRSFYRGLAKDRGVFDSFHIAKRETIRIHHQFYTTLGSDWSK